MSEYLKRGKKNIPLGAVWSNNPEKAEKTIKNMSSSEKRDFWKRNGKKI